MDAAERRHSTGAEDLPAIVFAPARPDIRADHRDGVVFEVRRASDGGLALDFGQQWHQHSALGILTDFGAAGVGSWDDTKQLVGDIGGAAKSVWHGVTSLF